MRKHRTAEQWQVLIGQQRDSGLSATQFCKEHKLGYASFCSWRKRLLSQPVGEAADSGYASFLDLSSLMDCGFHDTWTPSPRSFGHSFHAHLDT
ncbi:TPA: IS66 family insertion sequence element accessory protein TnpB [Pseudomonas aeruginosa]